MHYLFFFFFFPQHLPIFHSNFKSHFRKILALFGNGKRLLVLARKRRR